MHFSVMMPSAQVAAEAIPTINSVTTAGVTASSTSTPSNNSSSTNCNQNGSGSPGSGNPNSNSGSGNLNNANNSSNNNNNNNSSSNMNSVAYVDNEACGIKDVWSKNLEEEFKAIRKVVQKYPFVAMDTEFPGVVARPIGEFRSTSEYQYQLLRCNVDLLKIIQLGLTFLNESGETPPGFSTWQFNFKFNLTEDMYAQDSIDLLQNSGIQFKKHEEEGIDPYDFAELLMSSGVVLNENVKWLSFHSGYDFGYLLKILTDTNLPQEESEFFELLRIYFPAIYDVKYLMKSCKNLKGGLQEVAEQLELERVGPQHQAGSDSLLTGAAFFKMREMFFEDNIDDAKYCGHLYGLGTSYVVNGNSFHDGTESIVVSPTSSSVTSTTTTTATPASAATTTAVVTSYGDASTTTSVVTSSTS